jgi:hypothetical protein
MPGSKLSGKMAFFVALLGPRKEMPEEYLKLGKDDFLSGVSLLGFHLSYDHETDLFEVRKYVRNRLMPPSSIL